MAHLIDLETHTDNRGNLVVIENVLPFAIKRVFYIYGVDKSERGGHRHHKTIQAAICIQGECKIFNNNGKDKEVFHLNKPSKCLLLEPKDWHKMYNFSDNAILMVLASENFDEKDYIFGNYD
jgi:dTDP-4-dehydrorhamnose 3,5-epimerase-like enzyme